MLVNNSFHIFKLYECIPFSHSLNIIKKNVMSENIGALKIKYRQTSDNMLLRSKGWNEKFTQNFRVQKTVQFSKK